MPFSMYDPDAVRLLSAVLSEATRCARKCAGSAFTESDASEVSKRITADLLAAYDRGVRAPSALTRAGLRNVLVVARDAKAATNH